MPLTIPPATQAATIVYPANWFTVTAPPTAACRYFDLGDHRPGRSVDAEDGGDDPGGSRGVVPGRPHGGDEPDRLNVLTNQPVTVSGLPATRLQAT